MSDPNERTGAQRVVFTEVAAGHRRIGFARLEAVRALNALNLPMIRQLLSQLQAWGSDRSIACVVLYGSGEKAFCAGGNLRALYKAMLEYSGPPPNPQVIEFFSEEYRPDYVIHTYPKPVMVWGGGIVMGGGLGLMAGASHRIVTETSRLAMPEITIGLFPDVGASYFLHRLPGRTGLFLALTGAVLNGHDSLIAGIANNFLRDADRDAVFGALTDLPWADDPRVNRRRLSKMLDSFTDRATSVLPASPLQKNFDTVEMLLVGSNLKEVHHAIVGYGGDDRWLRSTAETLAAGSPTTAHLIWELLRRTRGLSLRKVLELELVVAIQCCAHPDLTEGIRAQIIDKDNSPRWTPPTLGEVTQRWVEAHFTAPWGGRPPFGLLGTIKV